MLVELRTYTVHPGRWLDYLALYEAKGLAIQRRILGRMVGYYRTEVGALNQIVHLWAYEDLSERGQRRDALMADLAWLAYIAEAMPMLKDQDSKILVPAPFFEPQWQE